MAYIRSGDCNRCGDCCKGDPFLGQEGTPELDGYCPLLQLSDGIFTCSNRKHEYYLKGCNVFPSHPDQIKDKPNCSYTFTWIDDAGDNT